MIIPTEQEIKDAALEHIRIVNGNNACYDSFIHGANWAIEKSTSCNHVFEAVFENNAQHSLAKARCKLCGYEP